MKTSKTLLLVAAIVLLAGLSAGAFAQRKAGALRLTPEPIMPVTYVNAIEVTDGTFGFDGQTKEETAFGYSFLGRTTGAYPGSFTISMNCAPAQPIPGDSSQIRGGSWTLPVYLPEARTGYSGSLYGTVAKGTMTWDKTGTSANLSIVLSVDGGTQAWEGTQGYATFAGTLLVDEKTQKTTLTGNLVFNTISATLSY